MLMVFLVYLALVKFSSDLTKRHRRLNIVNCFSFSVSSPINARLKRCLFGTGGTHGYSNELSSMHPFFIAHGPVFKSGLVSEPFNSVDIYPLICEILHIRPAPNNGSLDNIQHIMKTVLQHHEPIHLFGYTITAVTCTYIILYLFWACITIIIIVLLIKNMF